MRKKIMSLVLALVMVTALLPVSVVAQGVSVEIDGQPVVFADQAPAIVDGRTLVPVRGVFEELGFAVEWETHAPQTATLRNDAYTVHITVGSATFTTNGQSHQLDVPAQIIGGRTMIPLRAVVESVGLALEWDGATSTVLITTGAQAETKIESGTLARITEAVDLSLLPEYIRDWNDEHFELWRDATLSAEEIAEIERWREEAIAWTIGMDEAHLHTRNVNQTIGYRGGLLRLVNEPYELNIDLFNSEYKRLVSNRTTRPNAIAPEVAALAQEIIRGISGDMERARAIHLWVAENIWYDFDMFEVSRSRQFALEQDRDAFRVPLNSISTLEYRRGTCGHFALLTMELLESVGIPALYVTGFGWLNLVIGHAWTEAYIDGRWVIMDTTAASNNRFENGEFFSQMPPSDRWFDVSLERYSYIMFMLSYSGFTDDSPNRRRIIATSPMYNPPDPIVVDTDAIRDMWDFPVFGLGNSTKIEGFRSTYFESGELRVPVQALAVALGVPNPSEMPFFVTIAEAEELLSARIELSGGNLYATSTRATTAPVVVNGQRLPREKEIRVEQGTMIVQMWVLANALNLQGDFNRWLPINEAGAALGANVRFADGTIYVDR